MDLKELFNVDLIATMEEAIAEVYPEFELKQFKTIAQEQLEQKSFKARAQQIAIALGATLPQAYPQAIAICKASFFEELGTEQNRNFGLNVFYYLPFSEFVVLKGIHQEYLTLNFDFLRALTKRFTAEFVIRYFYINFPQETIQFALSLCKSTNVHERRLASEGIRPLLPWGLKLQQFLDDPQPVLRILKELIMDEQEYVQKSVGNTLNDLAKSHPQLVLDFLQPYKKTLVKGKNKIAQLALRNLIKQGNPEALAFFGYTQTHQIKATLILPQKAVNLGEKLPFQIQVSNLSNEEVNLMIDFILTLQRKHGTQNKVFKGSKVQLKAQENSLLNKTYDFKPITTRKYYPGTHYISLQINGLVVATKSFELKKG